jgi:hypothetical protein
MSAPPWKFEGFVTAAGNRLVQKWFWDDADDDERDALRDRANYLSNLKKALWQEPAFKWFGTYGEIRKNVPRGALRVYGTFAEERDAFVFLHGHVKNLKKDPQGMDTAEKRLKRLGNGEGSTHGFNFEDKPVEEGAEGEGCEDETSGIESI